MDEIDLSNFSEEDLNSLMEKIGMTEEVQPGPEVSTDTPIQPEQVQEPSTEGQIQETSGEGIRSMEQVYQDRRDAGRDSGRPGIIGTAQDIAEGTARSAYQGLAPAVGVLDTFIDTLNLLEAGRGFEIPKLPKYESDTTQALRNISGLIIPSLGLRAKLLQYGAKTHAAGTAAPWLQIMQLNKTKKMIMSLVS